jgi:lysophospholipase L1-like esterase
MNYLQKYFFDIIIRAGFGMTFSFLLLSCKEKETIIPVFPNPPVVPVTPAVKKYLALGDSYTIGEGVLEIQRFPYQAIEMLRWRNFNMMPPDYIAATGWTTQSLLNAIKASNPPDNYDLVSLLIGVNNQYSGRDTGEYRQQFTLCLEQAIRLAKGKKERVFVVSIPDYGATPQGKRLDPIRISREINWFNAINKEITLAYKISYTDITPGTLEAATNPLLVATDGLHPSHLEYAKWAKELAPKMEAALK